MYAEKGDKMVLGVTSVYTWSVSCYDSVCIQEKSTVSPARD